MPLRDHFQSPLDDLHSWDELHGMWPAMIVRQLMEVLPEPYYAAPGVHLGTLYEVDVATYQDRASDKDLEGANAGGVATATYSPPKPNLALQPHFPNDDVYEVRIYDSRRNRRLVAAIELVSPSNSDRPESRGAFISKVAALLKHDVCVSVVDVVSTSKSNLYAQILNFLDGSDPDLDNPPPLYAATIRLSHETGGRVLDGWFHALEVGETLPTLPVWLTQTQAVPLDLEPCYEETCRLLRIR